MFKKMDDKMKNFSREYNLYKHIKKIFEKKIFELGKILKL